MKSKADNSSKSDITGIPETTDNMLSSVSSPDNPSAVFDRKVLVIVAAAVLTGLTGGLLAQGLLYTVKFINTLVFYGEFSAGYLSPSISNYDALIILIPAAGGLLTGLLLYMSNGGHKQQDKHEEIENVIGKGESLPCRTSILRPLSSVIAIGTGAPYGVEGPVIAAGGWLGSLFPRFLNIREDEARTLLAAGAAAGMAGLFGSPFAAILLSVELLLSEYGPRTLVPVSIAAAAATGVRILFHGTAPFFDIPELTRPDEKALVIYVIIGGLAGFASILLTWAAYYTEHLFKRLPVHRIWLPAIGGLAIGAIGYASPGTMGAGYDVINLILSGDILENALIILFLLKFMSWVIATGSTMSGGTLAPLFIIGGGFGATVCSFISVQYPWIVLDTRMAALVGMASLFGGASRAMLTSTVFVIETTLQIHALVPLIGGCTLSYFISNLVMRNSMMAGILANKGMNVSDTTGNDILDNILVREVASYGVATLNGSYSVEEVVQWLTSNKADGSHQGFPVIDDTGNLTGVITRRDIFDDNVPEYIKIEELVKRPPVVVYEDNTLREAVNIMSKELVGRLPVVIRSEPRKVRAILTRSDVLRAHGSYLDRKKEEEGKRGIFGKNRLFR